jgi:SAM-dependent methyltransferase
MAAGVKAYKGAGMEGMVAQGYARNTAKSMNDFRSEARRVAALLAPEANVLEVAPGPGYFANELAKLGGYSVTGLDISKTFVEIARRNTAGGRGPNSAGAAPRTCLSRPTNLTFCSAARRSRIFPSRCGPCKRCTAFSSRAGAP